MAIVIPIGVDTSGLTRGLSQGTSGLRKFGKMAALVGGAAALGGLVATLKIGVDEFMGAQKVLAQTGAVLKSTGGAANVTSKQIGTMSESLMKLSGVDDEAIQSGQNLLLTFTKIRNETGAGNKIFDQATVAMLDLSVAMGTSLNSAAILVGKALNDPVKGVGALSKAGVQFTASQKDTIKALVESGDVMGAQKMILKELETQFAGSAEAAGKTLPGQLNILKQTFSNTAAELVTVFIPYLSRATKSLLDFVRQFSAQPTFKGKVSFVIDRIKDFVGNSYDSLQAWWNTSKPSVTQPSTIPFKVNLTGKQEVEKGFRELQALAAEKGGGAGKSFANSFFERGVGGNFSHLFGKIFDGLKFVFRYSGIEAALTFVGGFVVESARVFYARRGEILDAIVNAIKNLDWDGSEALTGAAADAFRAFLASFRRGSPAFVGVITKTVRDAVTGARQALSGLGGTLGAMLSDITGTSSPEAKQAAAIRAQQKAEAAAREKTRLESALATAQTADERTQARQDLNDFLLDQDAQRLEDSVAQQQSANQRAIDDLIAEFNRGDLAARDFRSRLDAIIGAGPGADLGMAFADGFTSAFDQIINAVKDLAGVQNKVGGREIKPVPGTPAAEAARAAHAEWKAGRAERLKSARDARRTDASDGGSKITDAEQKRIDQIMAAYDKANPEPVRMAAGGILKRQVFTAGEAGREAVIPLGSSEAMGIMRDALGGGGGGTT